MESILLGRVTIESVNQIGERIKFNPKTGGFILAKRGSVFSLHARVDRTTQLADFRGMSSIPISIEVEGRYLACDPVSGKAVMVLQNDSCSNTQLCFVKRKYSGSSTSISYTGEGTERWLRHSNSRLRVCENE